MIHVLLDGRIGNNLFQIAAAASLAYNNNSDYKVIPGDYLTPGGKWLSEYLKQFETNILRKVPFTEQKPENPVIYKEKDFSYSPIPYSENLLMQGFYQSEKYFNPKIVQDLFEIDQNTKQHIFGKYGHLLKEEITSIHVRRGDYLKSSDNYAVCSYNYFRDAINYIGKDKKFLITSDDIAWCKSKFKGENFYFSEGESAIVDMYLQSMCTNNIISNSSFSWWGAWLNKNPNKIVIVPQPWFGIAFRNKNTRDLVPESWTKLTNKTPLVYRMAGYYIWWRKRIDYFYRNKIKG
ncbi:MAG: alpha-1,2-fucosyltransferase [Prolixibacteraceae bacterium]|nr:alpha-1,2-fucosyltransferase [Prolixibacteraceae bacterium]